MILALDPPKFVWYLMRASGLVALVLVSVTVALGVVGVARLQSRRWPRLITAQLHRNLSLLALCFLGLHIVTAMLDSWVGLSWFGFLVPFQSSYRALWLGLGVLAVDLLLAVVATSVLRRFLSYRAWQVVHIGAWLLWPLAMAHAWGAGTDRAALFAVVIEIGCAVLVVAAAIYRFWLGRAPHPAPPVMVPEPLPAPVAMGTPR